MKRFLLFVFAVICSLKLMAQLEVKDGSFKEVAGFVNINIDKMYDDNDKPYSVLKVKTENIDDKQRHQLLFQGDARTFIECEYNVGEVWVYLSYYATYLKISHPDLSSTEFWFPFDMKPKCGYELILINKPSVDVEILNRIERLEGAYNTNQNIAIDEDNTPEKTLNGRFTVGKYKQVCFSQGNLQYRATTGTWRFAENQWDIIGEKNKNISPKYDSWIDLFGFGTSGYDDKYPPYRTQFSIEDAIDSDIAGTNYDWGVYNAISNGGKEADLWRTLTGREWNRLFNKRATKSGLRFVKAQVNSVNGVVLFPDDWNNSEQDYTVAESLHNKVISKYTNCIITKSDWEKYFEANGAVFLPAAGCRYGSGSGNKISAVGEDGYYWSSTDAKGEEDAHNLYFDHDSLRTNDTSITNDGLSVRLVRDVK